MMHSTDAFPLPPRPNIEQYKKQAKELAAAVKSRDRAAVEAWVLRLLEQHFHPGHEGDVVGRARRVQAEAFAKHMLGEVTPRGFPPAKPTLAYAQYILARLLGFPTWAAMSHHIDDLLRQHSAVALFESAVEAIVTGDIETLRRMLREHPELIRARSSRGHGATLLHYVSANGVEGWRQKTPPNIVAITTLLLDSGADVDARAHCYGENDDTLGLTATSAHPANAGVMIPMLELLVAKGADVQATSNGLAIVRSCLANGQPEAAAWLADHGARVDLGDAAGLGRMDAVRSFLSPDGTLLNGATPLQLEQAWAHATWYGQLDAVRYLLEAGADVNRGEKTGVTALHRASYTAKVDLAGLLIARGANVNATETEHGGTPLDWALHARAQRDRRDHEALDRTIALLRRAGGISDNPPLEG